MRRTVVERCPGSVGRMWFSAIEVPGDGERILAVTGDLDLSAVPQFRSALRGLGATGGHVVVDLTGVEVIDSVGIGLLLGARRRVVEAGGSFAVRCGPGRVARLLELTAVAEILGLEHTT